jgi:hypothetical protein
MRDINIYMSNAKNLVEIWDLYSKTVLNEKAPAQKAAKFGKKAGPGAVDRNDIKKAQQIANKDTSGPGAADGLNTDILDVKNPKHKDDPRLTGLTFGENFDKNIEKTSNAKINNYMKSIFDKLFEEVMDGNDQQDLAALGVGDDAGMEDPADDMGGEEKTVTLTADQVECLRAILAQIDGGDIGEDEGADDMGADDMGGEETDLEASEEDAEEVDEDEPMKEAVTSTVDNPVNGSGKTLPDSAGAGLMKMGSIKVNAKLKPKGGQGKGDVNNPVDGSGKTLPDSTGAGLMKMGAIKVGGTKTSKPGGDFFA